MASSAAAPEPATGIPGEATNPLRLILLALPMRLVVDTAMRMFYPFLPEISRGLGITLSQAGLLVSLRSAMILTSPLFGSWGDRHEPRPLLAAALLLQGLSLAWMSSAQGLAAAVVPALLLGVVSAAFIPTLQSVISEHVPFQRRGRILGIVEFSWALTGLIILPLVGIMMVARGWQAPLRVVAGLSFVVAPLPLLLPKRRRLQDAAYYSMRQGIALVWQTSSARAAIAVSGLMFLAAESFFVTYGAWLEQGFGLAPDRIGRVAALLGLAELAASGLSSLFIDRIGKRLGVGLGLLAMTVSMAVLPLLGGSLQMATAGLFAFTFSFEFSIVSGIGLLSEQVPEARGTVLSMSAMSAALTRAISGFAGIALFEWRGIGATATLATLGSAMALFVLLRWVVERAPDPAPVSTFRP
jgi:predicted MFS family arabinose efflux permease